MEAKTLFEAWAILKKILEVKGSMRKTVLYKQWRRKSNYNAVCEQVWA